MRAQVGNIIPTVDGDSIVRPVGFEDLLWAILLPHSLISFCTCNRVLLWAVGAICMSTFPLFAILRHVLSLPFKTAFKLGLAIPHAAQVAIALYCWTTNYLVHNGKGTSADAFLASLRHGRQMQQADYALAWLCPPVVTALASPTRLSTIIMDTAWQFGLAIRFWNLVSGDDPGSPRLMAIGAMVLLHVFHAVVSCCYVYKERSDSALDARTSNKRVVDLDASVSV